MRQMRLGGFDLGTRTGKIDQAANGARPKSIQHFHMGISVPKARKRVLSSKLGREKCKFQDESIKSRLEGGKGLFAIDEFDGWGAKLE